jgi:hypothetical protein
MSGMFGGPDIPPVVPPPDRSDAEIQAAALKERQRRAGAMGREATILTDTLGDPEGTPGVSTSVSKKKQETLLGTA